MQIYSLVQILSIRPCRCYSVRNIFTPSKLLLLSFSNSDTVILCTSEFHVSYMHISYKKVTPLHCLQLTYPLSQSLLPSHWSSTKALRILDSQLCPLKDHHISTLAVEEMTRALHCNHALCITTAHSDMHSPVLRKDYIKYFKTHSEQLTEVNKTIQIQAES
jgi:hypothetical protein